jgi:hypothetical protein
MMREYVLGGQKLIKTISDKNIEKCKVAAWKCTMCDSSVCVESLSKQTKTLTSCRKSPVN